MGDLHANERRAGDLRKEILLITLAYFLVRIPWLFSVPMVEAPDEFSHAWVFKFLLQHMRLPQPAEIMSGGPSAVYGPIPQLGYVPHVIAALCLPVVEPTLAGRFGSLAIGYLAVVAAYFLGRELFSKNKLAALALPYMYVFHPQLVLVNSYVNNDATTCALTTTISLILVRILKRGLTMRDGVVLGFLYGFTALSKYSGLAIFPASLVALLSAILIHRLPLARAALILATTAGITVLTSAWWFINTYNLYNGDILGTKTMRDIWARTYNRPLTFYMSPSRVIKQLAWWRMTTFSFWGMFGYMTRYMWRPAYLTYVGFMLVSAIFGVKQLIEGAIKMIREKVSDDETRKELWIERSIWSTFTTCVLFNLGAMIWASTINLGGPQGRYLFASEAPLMALLIAGLNNAPARTARPLLWALLVFNAAVAVGVMIWLFPIYGFRLNPIT